MSRTFAFLRAINVGKRRVKMDRLRAVFEAAGLVGVETHIASGNVVFETPTDRPDLRTQLEAHLLASLGYPVDTFLRSPDALRAVAAFDALDEADGHTLRVGFLHDAPPPDALAPLGSATDILTLRGRELYWLCRTSFQQSRVSGAAIERILGQPSTLRRLRTVQRMVNRWP